MPASQSYNPQSPNPYGPPATPGMPPPPTTPAYQPAADLAGLGLDSAPPGALPLRRHSKAAHTSRSEGACECARLQLYVYLAPRRRLALASLALTRAERPSRASAAAAAARLSACLLSSSSRASALVASAQLTTTPRPLLAPSHCDKRSSICRQRARVGRVPHARLHGGRPRRGPGRDCAALEQPA